MKFAGSALALTFCCALSAPAVAAPKVVIQPVQQANESIRYNHGAPTVDIFSQGGSVQVRPAPMDHGSLAFNIAVFNDGTQSANIDVSNFSLTSQDTTVGAFSVDTLEKKAKSRAAWSQVGLALAGGLSAAAAASQRDTYRSTFHTPRGVYRSYYSAPSTVGQIQAAAIVAGTGVGIAAIQNRLDRTLDELGEQIIQMSTVDPHESYAGKIVFEKVKLAKLPMQVTVVVDWNGQKYPFTFQIAKPGTPAPPFRPAVIETEPQPAAVVDTSPLAAMQSPDAPGGTSASSAAHAPDAAVDGPVVALPAAKSVSL
jgi:hypothetical protein